MQKHHIIKQQFLKKRGINPDFKMNIIQLSHDFHGKIHSKSNQGKIAREKLYYILEERLIEMKLSKEKYFFIESVYWWCTIEDWSKLWYIENMEVIDKGIKLMQSF